MDGLRFLLTLFCGSVAVEDLASGDLAVWDLVIGWQGAWSKGFGVAK